MAGAVILGAGFGRRFGADKRLHPLGDSTVARTTLATYLASFTQVRLVIRDDDFMLQQHVGDLPVEIVTTEQAAKGMGYSMRAGFAGLSWKYAFLALLDMPFIRQETLEKLQLAATETHYQKIIRPRLTTQTAITNLPPWGHPIGFPHFMFTRFATLRDDQGARQILQANAQDIVEFETRDLGVIRDIDQPSDLPAAPR